MMRWTPRRDEHDQGWFRIDAVDAVLAVGELDRTKRELLECLRAIRFEVDDTDGYLRVRYPQRREWDNQRNLIQTELGVAALEFDAANQTATVICTDGAEIQCSLSGVRQNTEGLFAGVPRLTLDEPKLSWEERGLVLDAAIRVENAPPIPDETRVQLTIRDKGQPVQTVRGRIRSSPEGSNPVGPKALPVEVRLGPEFQCTTDVIVTTGFAGPALELADGSYSDTFSPDDNPKHIRFTQSTYTPQELDVELRRNTDLIGPLKAELVESPPQPRYRLVARWPQPALQSNEPTSFEVFANGQPAGRIELRPNRVSGFFHREGAESLVFCAPNREEWGGDERFILGNGEAIRPDPERRVRCQGSRMPLVWVARGGPDHRAAVDDRAFEPVYLTDPRSFLASLDAAEEPTTFGLSLVDGSLVEGRLRLALEETFVVATASCQVGWATPQRLRERIGRGQPVEFHLEDPVRQGVLWRPPQAQANLPGEALFFRGLVIPIQRLSVGVSPTFGDGAFPWLRIPDSTEIRMDGGKLHGQQTQWSITSLFLPLRAIRDRNGGDSLWILDPPAQPVRLVRQNSTYRDPQESGGLRYLHNPRWGAPFLSTLGPAAPPPGGSECWLVWQGLVIQPDTENAPPLFRGWIPNPGHPYPARNSFPAYDLASSPNPCTLLCPGSEGNPPSDTEAEWEENGPFPGDSAKANELRECIVGRIRQEWQAISTGRRTQFSVEFGDVWSFTCDLRDNAERRCIAVIVAPRLSPAVHSLPGRGSA